MGATGNADAVADVTALECLLKIVGTISANIAYIETREYNYLFSGKGSKARLIVRVVWEGRFRLSDFG